MLFAAGSRLDSQLVSYVKRARNVVRIGPKAGEALGGACGF